LSSPLCHYEYGFSLVRTFVIGRLDESSIGLSLVTRVCLDTIEGLLETVFVEVEREPTSYYEGEVSIKHNRILLEEDLLHGGSMIPGGMLRFI
jgi:hypothetical protein